MRNKPMFSVKYENPECLGEIWAADWDWGGSRKWGMSRSSRENAWELVKGEIDEVAWLAILKKFGIEDYKKDFPIDVIGEMSPSALIEVRRILEGQFCLPKLDAVTDNRHAEIGVGLVSHYAEEYY